MRRNNPIARDSWRGCAVKRRVPDPPLQRRKTALWARLPGRNTCPVAPRKPDGPMGAGGPTSPESP
eukprot:1265712-Lingulodinium_polyedra.AAC.1